MRFAIVTLAAALACGTAFAQAPAGTVARPSNQQNPNASGGQPQAKGEVNAQAKGKDSGATTTASATMGHKAMDANGDGFVTRKEWDTYHGKMWSGMKGEKRGVPWATVESGMMGQGGTPK
jgi:hypothetical protein